MSKDGRYFAWSQDGGAIVVVFNDFLQKKGAVHGFSQGCLHF